MPSECSKRFWKNLEVWNGLVVPPLSVPTPLTPFANGARTPDRTVMTVSEACMQANTFDVIERRKHITFFKLGKPRS